MHVPLDKGKAAPPAAGRALIPPGFSRIRTFFRFFYPAAHLRSQRP